MELLKECVELELMKTVGGVDDGTYGKEMNDNGA